MTLAWAISETAVLTCRTGWYSSFGLKEGEDGECVGVWCIAAMAVTRDDVNDVEEREQCHTLYLQERERQAGRQA